MYTVFKDTKTCAVWLVYNLVSRPANYITAILCFGGILGTRGFRVTERENKQDEKNTGNSLTHNVYLQQF